MRNEASARRRMIDSAIQLFSAQGIFNTAMSDIVKHSGAPRGSVYYHFPGGKEQIANEATLLAGEYAATAFRKSLENDGPLGAVRMFVDHYARQLEESDFVQGCPIAAGALVDQNMVSVRSSACEIFASWEKLLSDSFQQFGVAKERAEDAAALVISSVEGALILAKARQSAAPLERVRRELTRTVASVLAGAAPVAGDR